MILETMPAARLLSSSEKRQLAEELWTSADAEEGEISVDANILRLLDQRLTDHAKQPQATSSWDEVKRRIFDGHARESSGQQELNRTCYASTNAWEITASPCVFSVILWKGHSISWLKIPASALVSKAPAELGVC